MQAQAAATEGEKVQEPKAAPATKKHVKASVRWLSALEVAQRYGNINEATLSRWVARSQFPEPVSFGGRLRLWDERELDEFDATRKAARDASKEAARTKRREREDRATKKARGEA